jgi:hypothetical protein
LRSKRERRKLRLRKRRLRKRVRRAVVGELAARAVDRKEASHQGAGILEFAAAVVGRVSIPGNRYKWIEFLTLSLISAFSRSLPMAVNKVVGGPRKAYSIVAGDDMDEREESVEMRRLKSQHYDCFLMISIFDYTNSSEN